MKPCMDLEGIIEVKEEGKHREVYIQCRVGSGDIRAIIRATPSEVGLDQVGTCNWYDVIGT